MVRFLFFTTLLFSLGLNVHAQVQSTSLFYSEDHHLYDTKHFLLEIISTDSVMTSTRVSMSSPNLERENNLVRAFHALSFEAPVSFLDTSITTFVDAMRGDTIWVNSAALPLSPFNQLPFNLPDLWLPVYNASVLNGDTWEVSTYTFRVPFPDSLLPETSLVSYPDSADVVITLTYSSIGTQMDTNFPYLETNLALSVELQAEVTPFIGPPFILPLPLIDSIPLRFFYGLDHLGFLGFSSEPFSIGLPEQLGSSDSTIFSLPGVKVFLDDLSLTNSIRENESLVPSMVSITPYPNPFNPSSTIEFTVTSPLNGTFEIYTSLGQPLKEFTLSQIWEIGTYFIPISMNSYSSGLYILRFTGTTRNGTVVEQSNKIFLIK